jgi:hypothetical protein
MSNPVADSINQNDELNQRVVQESVAIMRRANEEDKLRQLWLFLSEWGPLLAETHLVNWAHLSEDAIDQLWPDNLRIWSSTEGYCARFNHDNQTVQLSLFRPLNSQSTCFINLKFTDPESKVILAAAVNEAGLTSCIHYRPFTSTPDLSTPISLITTQSMFEKIPKQIKRKEFDPFNL